MIGIDSNQIAAMTAQLRAAVARVQSEPGATPPSITSGEVLTKTETK